VNKDFKIGQLVRQEYLGRYPGGKKKTELKVYLIINQINEEWEVLRSDGTRSFIHDWDLYEDFEVIS